VVLVLCSLSTVGQEEYFAPLQGIVLKKVLQGGTESKVVSIAPISNLKVEVYEKDSKSDIILLEYAITDKQGQFSFDLGMNKDFILKAWWRNHLNMRAVTTKSYDPLNFAVTLEFELHYTDNKPQKYCHDKAIYFDYGKSELTGYHKFILDSLSSFLEEKRKIDLELSGSSDYKEQKEIAENMPKKRTLNTLEYLLNRGLDSSRIKYRLVGRRINERTYEFPKDPMKRKVSLFLRD